MRVPLRPRDLAVLLLLLLGACSGSGDTGPSPRERARARALYLEATGAIERGSAQEAMELLDEAVALDPVSEEVHRARSTYGERAGLYDQVIESTEWLLQRSPQDADLLARLVVCSISTGRTDLGRRAIQRLKAVDGDSARTAALMAQFYFENGDFGLAEKHALRSAEIQPEQTLAHYLIGLAREYAGESELAIESFRRVIFVDPGHLGARDHLATLLLRLDRRKEANKHRRIHTVLVRAMPGAFRKFSPDKRIEDFTEVVELLPEWDLGHTELARARFELRELDEARASLETALALRPRSPEPNELMATLLRELGDEEGAARHASVAGIPWVREDRAGAPSQ